MRFNNSNPRYQYKRGDKNIESTSEEKDLSYDEQAGRTGFVQPGKEKPLGKTQSCFPRAERGLKKGRERLSSRACSDKIRQNDFELRDGRFILDTR